MFSSELLSLLVRSLAKGDDDRPWLMRLCEACVESLGAQGGAFTVSAGPGEWIAVSTPGGFEVLEPLQEVLGEGPMHQAMTEDRLVVTSLDSVVDDYPVFSQLAASAGGETTLYAAPMRAGGHVVGAFSLYVTDGAPPCGPEELQMLADATGATLLASADSLDWSESNLFQRAIGMVVAQLGVGPDDASAVMRARAFSRSTSLHSVAVDVLERRLTFGFDE
ncbi:GAF and ANTAR domain-containing protein [Promicromonospora iranensis]|uniref:GAF domain-containing protein n=1 Tax=Promicromonospora iranensis TaxID=1105144 RepID=A0ABU2CGQ4_9MICO|nr:GAF and ANTAR domain-containing protein [Promicromonospora iranensis]MDR7380505.1 hypothetical protein [Promicromonospora iranensis]